MQLTALQRREILSRYSGIGARETLRRRIITLLAGQGGSYPLGQLAEALAIGDGTLLATTRNWHDVIVSAGWCRLSAGMLDLLEIGLQAAPPDPLARVRSLVAHARNVAMVDEALPELAQTIRVVPER